MLTVGSQAERTVGELFDSTPGAIFDVIGKSVHVSIRPLIEVFVTSRGQAGFLAGFVAVAVHLSGHTVFFRAAIDVSRRKRLPNCSSCRIHRIRWCNSYSQDVARNDHEAKRWVVEQTCTDRSYRACPLRRALQKFVEDPLSEVLIEIYPDNNSLGIRLLAEEGLADLKKLVQDNLWRLPVSAPN